MILTLEAYKDNIYILEVLNKIYDDIKEQIDDNPFKDINMGDWSIQEYPDIKAGFDTLISFKNDTTKESIIIYFKTIDILNEDDNRFVIDGISSFKNNEEIIIDVNNYYVLVINGILDIIDEKMN